jgi:hypothetical protein
VEVSAASRRTSLQLHRVSALLWGYVVETKLHVLHRAVKANFNPNQPRIPAGNPDGGQWTDAGGVGSGSSQTSDTRVAQARRPRGRSSDGTPAQQVRRDIAEARARAAIERLREIDPNWNRKKV